MIETVGWAKYTALHFWCLLLFAQKKPAVTHTHTTLIFASFYYD